MIPYGRQSISRQDIDAVVAVLRSDWLTQGPMVPRFERAVSEGVGAKHAVAVNSATSALHMSCLALDLGPGDRLWTSPNTFVASANCALYCGARVDFVDVDPRTYNLSTAALAAKLEEAERSGALPKVVVPVHFAGQCCDMAGIHALSRRYGFKVIEDASHAVGGRYLNGAIGGCAFSDITIFSFHPVKIITTAEGGMALTNNAELADRMRRLRTHGITREPREMERVDQGDWYYEQRDLGFNYRMTDMQAALGLSQHGRLDEFIARRRQIARGYHESLADLPLILPVEQPGTESSFHLYVVQVDPDKAKVGRRALFDHLRKAGIGVNVHYIPVHTQPYYRRMGFCQGQYPVAEKYYMHAISLPMFAALSDVDIERVVNALKEGLSI
jgi:UDP-4-amino-4,6-dideoxy-N-acetyl-beta-L-altrosamine transaminase